MKALFLCYLLFIFGIQNTKEVKVNAINHISVPVTNNQIDNDPISRSLVKITSVSIIHKSITVNGVGFIINCKYGIVVSNLKIASKFHTSKIQMIDGHIYEANTIYDNTLLSFSLLQIKNPQNSTLNCENVKIIPSDYHPKVGSFVKFYGMDLSSTSNITSTFIQEGIVAKTDSNLSSRYGPLSKISYSQNANSIIFTHPNQLPPLVYNNQIIGMHLYSSHSSNQSTKSYALYIEYIDNLVNSYISQGKPYIDTGELGISILPIDIQTAMNTYNFNSKACTLERNTNSLLSISNVIEGFNSENTLYIGDILLTINNKYIGDNMFIIDEILNKNTGKIANIEVCRNGKMKKIPILVDNSQAYQTDTLYIIEDYIQKGSKLIFKDIDIKTRFQHPLFDMKGVLFGDTIWVQRVNTINIENCEDFLKEIIENNCYNNSLLEGYDLINRITVNINLKWETLLQGITKHEFNYKKHGWEKDKVSIEKRCFKLNKN